MLTYPKSTMRVRRMPMHLSSKRPFWFTLSRIFWKTIFWPLGGTAPPNIYTR